MKTMKTKTVRYFAILTVLAGLACLPVRAQFIFTTNNEAITITDYMSYNPSVVIPSTIHGYPVTSIATNAFTNGSHIITKIFIPNCLTNIGNYALTTCSSLTNITVEADNPSYTSTDGVLFNHDQTILYNYPRGLGGNYIIPASVTNIKSEASGDVILLPFDLDEYVKKGDLIVQLDETDESRNVQRATAEYQRAVAAYEQSSIRRIEAEEAGVPAGTLLGPKEREGDRQKDLEADPGDEEPVKRAHFLRAENGNG